jgi:hypothetical protein
MTNINALPQLISEQVFENWAFAWQKLEFDTNPFNFFKEGDQTLSGVVFDSHNMSSLLSTTGVSTIKIRFGLNVETADFEIILFGTDNMGTVMTPYYVPCKKNYFKPETALEEGKVPTELIKQWKKNWEKTAGAGHVTNMNFITPYGFTRGYNYSLKEFIETLFTFQTAPDIQVVFVLHTYYGVNYLTTKETTSTFGVVLHAQKPGSSDADLQVDPDAYYDLTAPCPRTC